MIYEITKGKVSLDDFEVPTQCTLRRVQHGEKRYSEDVDGMTLYYIKKMGSRQDPKRVFARKRAERPLASPMSRRRFRGDGWRGSCRVSSQEDDLGQARQDPQGHQRSQACRRALLQQTLRGSQVVVSIPVWAKQQAIRKRCERFLEKSFVVRFPGVGNSGRSSLLVSKQRQVNK